MTVEAYHDTSVQPKRVPTKFILWAKEEQRNGANTGIASVAKRSLRRRHNGGSLMRTMGKQEILIAYDEQPSSVYEIAIYTWEVATN